MLQRVTAFCEQCQHRPDADIGGTILRHRVLPVPDHVADWQIQAAKARVKQNPFGHIVYAKPGLENLELLLCHRSMLLCHVVESHEEVCVGSSIKLSAIRASKTNQTISILSPTVHTFVKVRAIQATRVARSTFDVS